MAALIFICLLAISYQRSAVSIDAIYRVREKRNGRGFYRSFLVSIARSLFTQEIKGLDDFELICFLVVK